MSKSLSIQSILIPVDFSRHSQAALEQGVTLAKELNAKVHVLHIYRDKPTWADEVVTPVTLGYTAANFDLLLREAAEMSMEKLLKPYAGLGKLLSHEVTQGSGVKAILEICQSEKHDLVVMGRKGGSDLPHVLLGSTSDKVVRNSHIPVLVVPEKPVKKIKKILVPVDFSDTSKDGLDWGLALAKKTSASIEVLYVTEPPMLLMSAYEYLPPLSLDADLLVQIEKAEKETLDSFLRPYREKDISLKAKVVSGMAPMAIMETAEESQVDLIVMGSHERGKIGHFLMGSIAEKVLAVSTCPVLIIKHHEKH